MSDFQLTSSFEPRGDQPEAIRKLVDGFTREGKTRQTLLGVTGSGKTFTMANAIQQIGQPTLVISHNKTLAAQLYSEFKEFFPNNAVKYFVSYYDYYQPEAYIPENDIYIDKEATINEDIDRLRLASTSSLMARRDVVIVASVSCLFGLGSPEDYEKMTVRLTKGEEADRDEILRKLVDIQYERNDFDLSRGKFRARGDLIEVLPAYSEGAIRVEMFGDEIDRICTIDPLTGQVQADHEDFTVFPAKHFVMPEDRMQAALSSIHQELEEQLAQMRREFKLIEAQRLEMRTRYDLEMLQEVGYCQGIENYSRHLSGFTPGQRPSTLIDFFPDDFLTIVDESHVTIPQIRAMYFGDRSRKETLVEHGFRLPSALDNRPMTFEEWEETVGKVMFVSATPGDFELKGCGGEVVEQIIRPTGLLDPVIEVRSATNQVGDLMKEIRERAENGDRVLVTTLTKRLAEDLSDYIKDEGLRGAYLHSEIDTIQRVEILRDLRLGQFDVLVGVNLLREGLDLPEVTLVAILDADKEGFLRSETSLVQTIGRTARNVNARVILYADTVTKSMQRAIDETKRRRAIQKAYNEKHGIEPETIRKEIRAGIEQEIAERDYAKQAVHEDEAEYVTREQIRQIEEEMRQAAEELDFERAAELRDRVLEMQGKPPHATATYKQPTRKKKWKGAGKKR